LLGRGQALQAERWKMIAIKKDGNLEGTKIWKKRTHKNLNKRGKILR